MNIVKPSLTKISAIAALVAILGGCAATETALSHKDLEVQSRTSTAIFVDPVPQPKRTIYLDIKSGVMEFDRKKFKDFVKEQFNTNDNNYKIVDDPDQAQFQMVAYVLNLEKTNPTAAQEALGKGYMGGAIVAGAAIGAVGNSSHPMNGAVGLGVAAGAAELIAGSLVKNVTYMLVCDIQITEKAKEGVIVRKDTKINAKVSDAGSSQQTVSEASNRKEYRTRIVTTANKVNLKLEDAQDLMFKKTAYSLSGFF
jgi:hypothetical protein